MKHTNIILISIGLSFFNCIDLYSSAQGKFDDLGDIEIGGVAGMPHTNKPVIVAQPNVSHEQVAQQLKLSGLDVPEKFVIKHLDSLITTDPQAHSQLLGATGLKRKHKVNAQTNVTSSEKKEDDTDLMPDQAHIMKFISGAVTAELEGNEIRAKRDCNRLMLTLAIGASSLVINGIQAWFNSKK